MMDKATQGFRQGYRAGQDGTIGIEANPHPRGSFAHFDWDEGHKAGVNDRKWAEIYARRAAERAAYQAYVAAQRSGSEI